MTLDLFLLFLSVSGTRGAEQDEVLKRTKSLMAETPYHSMSRTRFLGHSTLSKGAKHYTFKVVKGCGDLETVRRKPCAVGKRQCVCLPGEGYEPTAV